MSERVLVLLGLCLFAAMAGFPFWHAQAVHPPAGPLRLPTVKGEDHCVEYPAIMRASHMVLLAGWRDAVVRLGEEFYFSKSYGTPYRMSLTKTCLACHTDPVAFCDQCHRYAGVEPDCWQCHLTLEGGVR